MVLWYLQKSPKKYIEKINLTKLEFKVTIWENL